jgi:hypothetical protein
MERSAFVIPANDADRRWLNRTVLGIGLASLFSDWSHAWFVVIRGLEEGDVI